jgi:conjugative relaxase-like TrwC/TraI family protein
MIRGHKVMVSAQAAYDEYHEKHVRQWQAYYEGHSAGDLGPEQEVAEGRTQAVADPALLAELGLEEGGHVSLEQVAALGAGRNPRTGELLVGARPGTDPRTGQPWDRVAYNDLVFSVPKSVSVEFAAARAAGDEERAQLLIRDVEASARVALERFAELLPLARQAAGSTQPAMARSVVLFNTHSTARPVRGQSVGDPQLHVHMRVLNLAKGDDGRWSSVNFRVLYHNVRVLNGLAESELQTRLRARGYETVPARHGDRRQWQSFELAHVPTPVIQSVSTCQAYVERLAQKLWEQEAVELQGRINEARAQEGLPPRELTAAERASQKPTLKQVQALSRANREDKLPLSRGELAAAWGRVLSQHGYRHQSSPGNDLRLTARQRERAVDSITAWALGAEGLTAQRSVWMRPDLLEEVVQHSVAAGLDADGIVEVQRRTEARAIQLGPGRWSFGNRLPAAEAALAPWTTPEMVIGEAALRDRLMSLALERRISVPEKIIVRSLAEEKARGRPLDPEQERAMRALCSPAGYVGVVGVAGSGKTTACRPAVTALTMTGYRVLGLAMSGGAAHVLEAETGALSWNVADFLTRARTGTLRDQNGQAVPLGPRSVLLVDEAGTVDSRTLGRLLRVSDAAGVAAIRAVGDPMQTQPVGAGGIFGWLSRQLPVCQLTVNYRQGEPEGAHEAQASGLLREGRGHDYLALKKAAGRLHIDPTLEASILHAVEHGMRDVTSGAQPATHMIISDLNLVVDRANDLVHQRLVASGKLSEPRVLLGAKELAVGDRVSFVTKHVELGPRQAADGAVLRRLDATPRMQALTTPRRTRGEVVGIDLAAADGLTITVRTDDSGRLPSRTVHLNAEQASHELDWGYAMTTAGSQGKTWEKTYGTWTGSRITGLEQGYTATSRARQATVDYLNSDGVHAEVSPERTLEEDTTARMGKLISRRTAKLTTLDYLASEGRGEHPEEASPAPPLSTRADQPQPILEWVGSSRAKEMHGVPAPALLTAEVFGAAAAPLRGDAAA